MFLEKEQVDSVEAFEVVVGCVDELVVLVLHVIRLLSLLYIDCDNDEYGLIVNESVEDV